METKLIKIGNSYAIIIPDLLIEDYKLKHTLEICPTGDGIIINPKKKAREGWAEQLATAIAEEHSPDKEIDEWVL
ncbi:MAG: hypothetical protein JWR09_3353 [Mucilaginibacter sp.]|nr:hypothetical protein [Mucilaginibacter sp.]